MALKKFGVRCLILYFSINESYECEQEAFALVGLGTWWPLFFLLITIWSLHCGSFIPKAIRCGFKPGGHVRLIS